MLIQRELFLFPNKPKSWLSIIDRVFYFDDVELYETLKSVMMVVSRKTKILKYILQESLLKMMIENGSVQIMETFFKNNEGVKINHLIILGSEWIEKNDSESSYATKSIIRYFYDRSMFLNTETSLPNQRTEHIKQKQKELFFDILVYSAKHGIINRKTLILNLCHICKLLCKMKRIDLCESICKLIVHCSMHNSDIKLPLTVHDRISLDQVVNKKQSSSIDHETKKINSMICVLKSICPTDKSASIILFSQFIEQLKQFNMNHILSHDDYKLMFQLINQNNICDHAKKIINHYFEHSSRIGLNLSLDHSLLNMIIISGDVDFFKHVCTTYKINLVSLPNFYSYFYSCMKSMNMQILKILFKLYKDQIESTHNGNFMYMYDEQIIDSMVRTPPNSHKPMERCTHLEITQEWVAMWLIVFEKIKKSKPEKNMNEESQQMVLLFVKDAIIQWYNEFSQWIYPMSYICLDRVWYKFLCLTKQISIPYFPLISIYSSCMHAEKEVCDMLMDCMQHTMVSSDVSHLDRIDEDMERLLQFLCTSDHPQLNIKTLEKWLTHILVTFPHCEYDVAKCIRAIEEKYGDVFHGNSLFELSKSICFMEH